MNTDNSDIIRDIRQAVLQFETLPNRETQSLNRACIEIVWSSIRKRSWNQAFRVVHEFYIDLFYHCTRRAAFRDKSNSSYRPIYLTLIGLGL
jgi:hypothetical protein